MADKKNLKLFFSCWLKHICLVSHNVVIVMQTCALITGITTNTESNI